MSPAVVVNSELTEVEVVVLAVSEDEEGTNDVDDCWVLRQFSNSYLHLFL